METFLQYLVNPFGIAIIAIVFGCLAGTISCVAKEWRRTRQAELDATLRHKMLDQGMSSEEISRILEAGAQNNDARVIINNK